MLPRPVPYPNPVGEQAGASASARRASEPCRTRVPGATPLPFVRAKMVMSLAWPGFQSTIRDLIPRFETSLGFCGSYMLLPVAQGRFAAGARPPPDPLTKDIDGGR